MGKKEGVMVADAGAPVIKTCCGPSQRSCKSRARHHQTQNRQTHTGIYALRTPPHTHTHTANNRYSTLTVYLPNPHRQQSDIMQNWDLWVKRSKDVNNESNLLDIRTGPLLSLSSPSSLPVFISAAYFLSASLMGKDNSISSKI